MYLAGILWYTADMHRKSWSGFSLIELLIVIAIFGILVGLILSASSQGRLKAYDAAIENGLRQIRVQAQIVFVGTGNSYVNWTQATGIQNNLTILLDDIDKNYGDQNPAAYVTVMRDSQASDFCVSAPSRANPGKYFCVDARASVHLTPAHCADQPSSGPALQCP